MSETKTPRTNTAKWDVSCGGPIKPIYVVSAEVAEALERELNASIANYELVREQNLHLAGELAAANERIVALEAKLQKAITAIEQATDDAFGSVLPKGEGDTGFFLKDALLHDLRDGLSALHAHDKETRRKALKDAAFLVRKRGNEVGGAIDPTITANAIERMAEKEE